MIRHTALRGKPAALVAFAVIAILLSACGGTTTRMSPNDPADASPTQKRSSHTTPSAPARAEKPRRAVTLAFAGDMHFELHLAALLEHPDGALGPIARTLADADLTMVNLESAIAERGTPEAKELEIPSQRYHFRTSAAALDVLEAAGVDVVTMANNHGADYGPVGLEDTFKAIRTSPIPVVGIGRGPAGGLRAVPGLDPGNRLRVPCRGQLAA